MNISQVELSEAERALLAERLQKARTKKKAKTQVIERRPEGEASILSFAQRRLWFLSQWEPDSPAYNIPTALRMVGHLNVTALRETFREIIRRHRVLQMIYVMENEEPIQVPHPESWCSLSVVDLGALLADKQKVVVQRLAAEEARRPFDLAQDAPIRTTLLRLNDACPEQGRREEHVLLLTIHHIATDGWSTGVLIKELVALYETFCDEKPSPLAELSIQYADFAYWQRNWLQGQVLDKQLDYWRQQLDGALAVLELPTDRPRPVVQTFDGALYHFDLSPSLTQAIKTLSEEKGASPFMILLAAFQALLHRYSGQDDIVVGSPIAGRNRSEIENMIGFFVNTLVLRTDLSGNPRGDELLERVREVTLGAYAHQDLPFEKLVEELRPERSLSHNPLFQVMFNYHNMPRSTLELPGLAVERMNVHSSTTKFDLKLAVAESNGEIRGVFAYNTDLFEQESIRRMADRFQSLLTGIVADPERPVAELPLLTPSERQQLLVEWNGRQTSYPQIECVHQLFEEQVARTPGAVAVISEGEQCTYQELNQRANQVAHYLQSLGVGPDVRVGLFMERSLDIMVGLLGILKAGGAYVPLDPIYPQERVRFMLENVQVPVLLTQTHLTADLTDLGSVRVVCLDGDEDTIAQYSDRNPPIAVTPSNLIYVLFTSGSTGRPKGVAVEHCNYLNYYHGVMCRMELPPGASYAMVSTFSTDLGTIMFWAPLSTGGTVHVFPYERTTDPEAMADYFGTHSIDVLKLVPSHFDALQGVPGSEAIIPRKLVIFTGEASHWETVSKVKALNPNCMVQDHYGVTETTCATLTYVAPDKAGKQQGALPLGQPLGNVRIYILDSLMEPAPTGIPGELYIGGGGVTRGYLNRPSLTAERFVPDPYSRAPGARLYRTGDLALYRSDGSIKLMGRMDHQVKIRGYRIETGEIETLLYEQPTVKDVVVVAREDTQGDRRLVAYVVSQPGLDGDFSTRGLRNHLRERLPDYMVPTAFVTLDAMPLNPNGKVDRFALPAPEYTRLEAGSEFIAPRNEMEERIAASWSEVLAVEKIGIDDNFFDLGGESFKAIRTVRKIGESVSVMDLFKYPTVRGLAEYLVDDQPRHTGLLYELTSPIPVDERVLSLVCIPHGGGNAVVFQPLANVLPDKCSLYAVQLPGHDYARRDEELQPLETVARQCAEEIKRDVTGPVALYGHCVGAAMAVEIARLLEDAGVEVTGIFMGGTFPTPRLPGKFFEMLARLFPRNRWVSSRSTYETLRAMGGFTEVVDPEELSFAIHALRHDAQEAEDYYTRSYATPEKVKVRAPIVCIIGQADRATEFYEERFREWGLFSGSVDLAIIPQAGHYFLKHQADAAAQIVADQLAAQQGKTTKAPVLAADGVLAADSVTVAKDHPVAFPGRPSLNIFFLIVFGQTISLIGTGISSFALGIGAFQENRSVTDFAYIFVFTRLATVLFAPIAGAVADRWDRRRVMIVSDLMAACGTLLILFLLLTNSLQVWHIYLTAFIGAIANAFQLPAYVAAVSQLVPKQYLGRANGLMQIGTATGGMIAPLLGGLLVGTIGLAGTVLIDLATFLFAVITLAVVRFPDTLFRRQQEEPLFQEIIKGWQYIAKRRGLAAMVIFFVFVNFLTSTTMVLITPLVLAFESPATLGVIGSAFGIGVLTGALTMSAWGGTKRRAEGMVGFVALSGLSIAVMGVWPAAIFVTIGLFGAGFAASLFNAHWQALIQAKVGWELQGRVIATNRMLALSLMPLGNLVAGPLTDRVFEPLMASSGPLAGSVGLLIGVGPGRGMGLMMILVGAIMTLWTILNYRYRPLRFMEDELPDAVPDAVIVSDRDELQRQADRQLLSKITTKEGVL